MAAGEMDSCRYQVGPQDSFPAKAAPVSVQSCRGGCRVPGVLTNIRVSCVTHKIYIGLDVFWPKGLYLNPLRMKLQYITVQDGKRMS